MPCPPIRTGLLRAGKFAGPRAPLLAAATTTGGMLHATHGLARPGSGKVGGSQPRPRPLMFPPLGLWQPLEPYPRQRSQAHFTKSSCIHQICQILHMHVPAMIISCALSARWRSNLGAPRLQQQALALVSQSSTIHHGPPSP